MSTRTEKMLDEIRRRFSRIASDIEMDNKSSLYDRNSHMERYFKQVLNAVYEINLVSTNLGISNYPAIDLKDATRKIAYQVTATNTKQKITNTIKTFFKNELDKEVETLNFLILKSVEGPKISTGSERNVDYEVITIYDLSRIISDIDDEQKISEIHDIVMVEYIVDDNSAVGIRSGAKFNLTSIQRLIDQVGFDPKSEFEEIESYGNEVEAFVKELSELTVEQRTVLYEMVLRSQTIRGDHKTLYMSLSRVAVEFSDRERLVIDSLVDLDLIRVDREFSINYFEPEIGVLLLHHGSEFDSNIFSELKTFASNNPDLLQKMFISLNFSCLAL